MLYLKFLCINVFFKHFQLLLLLTAVAYLSPFSQFAFLNYFYISKKAKGRVVIKFIA